MQTQDADQIRAAVKERHAKAAETAADDGSHAAVWIMVPSSRRLGYRHVG